MMSVMSNEATLAPVEGVLHHMVVRDALLVSRQDGVYAAVIATTAQGEEVARMDVGDYVKNPIVLHQHNPDRPIGRVVSGPTWRNNRWEAEFVFADGNALAQEIRQLWESDILRAISIGYMRSVDRAGLVIPILKEVSVVAVGMDPGALKLRSAEVDVVTSTRTQPRTSEGIDMSGQQDATATAEEREVVVMAADASADAVAADEQAEIIDDSAADEQDAASADEADDDESVDEEGSGDSVDAPVEERQMYAGRACNEESAEDAAASVQQVVDAAVKAAVEHERLRTRAVELLPASFDASTASVRELLEAACGSDVTDLERRSDDYLRGAVDQLLLRRAGGLKQQVGRSTGMIDASDNRPRNIRELMSMEGYDGDTD